MGCMGLDVVHYFVRDAWDPGLRHRAREDGDFVVSRCDGWAEEFGGDVYYISRELRMGDENILPVPPATATLTMMVVMLRSSQVRTSEV